MSASSKENPQAGLDVQTKQTAKQTATDENEPTTPAFRHSTDRVTLAPGQSRFESLPIEIRMIIYDLVLPDKDSLQGHIINLNTAGPGQQTRALLQTSSQVRREASKIYFKRANFWLHTGQGESKLKENCAYVRHVVRMCGPCPFKTFNCDVEHPVWDGLQKLLPFFDLLRETKLPEVFIYYDHLPYYVAHFFDYIEDIHQEVPRCLRRMMKVVKDARDRSWSKEKFQRKFAGLIKELREDAQDPFERF